MAIALVDVNNFYASCERLFRPELRGLHIPADHELRCPDKIGQSRIKQPEQFSNTSC